MAQALIAESGRNPYVIRRNRHDGDFIDGIRSVFEAAIQSVPSIILLDDMDKFAATETSTEEYIAVQACLDEISESDVFVIATVNSLRRLPSSLLRAGRFDRRINVYIPRGEESKKIIEHYMSSKSFVSDADTEDIAKMMRGKSCAELETLLNEAATTAGYERSKTITIHHIVKSFLRERYGVANNGSFTDEDSLKEAAYHEAGHAVVSEMLYPDSAGIVTLYSRYADDEQGYFATCRVKKDAYADVLISLGGRAAVEIAFGKACNGARYDLSRAVGGLTRDITLKGTAGLSAILIQQNDGLISEQLRQSQESVVHLTLEQRYAESRAILVENRALLDAVAKALIEKSTLLNSDIRAIKKACDYV